MINIRKLIQKIIRAEILLVLDDMRTNTPEFNFKILTSTKKFTVYDIIEHFDVKMIDLSIKYADLNSPATKNDKITGKTISEFRNKLINYKTPFPHFNECTLWVTYVNEMGEHRELDFIHGLQGKQIVESVELNNIIKTLIEWIDERPELLV